VLLHVCQTELLRLDDRFDPHIATEPVDDGREDFVNMRAYLACKAGDLWSYCRYIVEEPPFATQQGVKGAQFDRVLVVLDDEEGAHSHFSYGKYFGYVALSERDEQSIAEGNDSVLDRTRRLL
jgi:DNA helicase-2/ATP-dependent DNA helicase PcrA